MLAVRPSLLEEQERVGVGVHYSSAFIDTRQTIRTFVQEGEADLDLEVHPTVEAEVGVRALQMSSNHQVGAEVEQGARRKV